MPVYLNVESRLDRRAVETTAREITQIFNRLGADVSRGLGGSLGKAWSAFDTSGAREQLLQLERAWRRAADAEFDAAARMEVASRRASAATAKYGSDSARAMQAQALAAKSQRDYADALVLNEAAHKAHSKAVTDSAASAAAAGRVWNAVGVGSLAVFTGSVLEATKAAGNFQQSQQRLVSSAGETASNLKTVSDGILQLAGQVGYSAQQLSDGMYTVEKAGYRGADGVNVLKAAAQLAKAENADLGEVLNGVTTSMNDFGYSQDQAALVASKLNTAVGLAKTNLQDFSGALHSVEPIAAAAGLKLADVYGSLAQITQSGTSADQGAQNMAHSISQLMKPTQQMRDEMGQLGIDARDVQAHLGDRGFAGTVQYLSNTIRQHMNPAGQVVIDTMFKSQQAADAADQIFNNLPPAAKAVAQAIKDGTLSYKEFRKTRGGLDVEQANELNQWNNLNNKVTGYSAALKSGQGDIQTYEQALAILTGGQDSLRTVLQLVGVNADATNDKIQQIKDTTTAADGTVKGFNETAGTLNQKMADAKAAFNAATIELGNTFIPVMTSVANVAKTVGDELAKHPGIAQGVVTALGGLAGAWLGFKALGVAETILAPIASGLGNLIAGEEGATTAAEGLSGALRGIGIAGAGLAAAQIGGNWAQDHTSGGWHTAAVLGTDAATGFALGAGAGSVIPGVGTAVGGVAGAVGGLGLGIYHQLAGHAGGGPLHAPGPRGHDSALFWGADGEHVLTHRDVQAMGGHPGVYAFRNALHRQYGGAIGPDVQAAMSMDGAKYSQGDRTDCSGMVGRVINTALGIPDAGLPTTQNMGSWLAARGFVPGVGGPGTISVGWYNHGSAPNDGHTAMTLSDGENAESGGSHGNFIVGAGAAGASSPEFDHRMYLPELYGEGPATGGMGMPGFGGGAFGGGGFGGGGIFAGGASGVGPGGVAGFYTPNPQKVASTQEQLRHIDAEIAVAEKRRDELKSDAKQSERDRIDEEIRHLKAERVQEEQRLQQAERGTFHAGRGGMGGAGLPVSLADRFGLGKGLPGLAEWVVGFLEDLVLGPAETAIMAGLGGGMGGAPGGVFGPLDAGSFGSAGLDSSASLASVINPSVPGGYDTAASAGSDDGDASGGGTQSIPGMDMLTLPPSSSPPPSPSAPVAPPSAQDFYKDWYQPVPDMSLSGLPPNVMAWARAHGMVGSDGNYVGPMPMTPGRSARPPEHVTPFGGAADVPHPLGRAPGPMIGPPSHLPPSAWTPTPAHVAPPVSLPSSQQGFDFGGAGSGGRYATGGPVPRTSHLIPNPGNDDGGLGDSADGGGGNGRWDPFPRGVPGSTGAISGERPPGHAGAWHFAVGGAIPTVDLGPLYGTHPGPTPGGSGSRPYPGPGNDINSTWVPGWWSDRLRKGSGQFPWWMAPYNQGPPPPANDQGPHRPPTDDNAGGFGGPSGTDTIPSWLSPGEFVEQKSAVERYGTSFMNAINLGRVDPTSIRYLAGGGAASDFPLSPPKPPGPPAPPKPTGPGGAPKPGQLGKAGQSVPKLGVDAHTGLGPALGTADTHQGLQKPGAAKETFGQELPASGGIGFGGGVLGAAEGAASQAAGMAAGMGTFGAAGGAASSATQLAFQLINRTAAYGARAAGIGVEGLLETFLPTDSPLSNFGNTLPGKLLAGVAGVRPAQPNTAGQTQAPMTTNTGTSGQGTDIHNAAPITQIGVQMHGVSIHTNNAEQFHNDLQRQYSGIQSARPMNKP